MADLDLYRKLRALDRRRGEGSRALRIGDESIMLEGLDPTLGELLDLRWGGFVSDRAADGRRFTLRIFSAGTGGWLKRSPVGERYRIETINDAKHRVIVSYNFAICTGDSPGVWRVAINDEPDEPVDRLLDNVLRYFAARLAIERGGFAMHAAGLLREGRAYLLAGPSRSGKTTAVGLGGDATSLGDDLALVVRGGQGWHAPALPFDNSERIRHRPPEGLFPVAGVWRLHQASATRVERPMQRLAVASLLGCAAFPWALPDLADPLLGNVKQLIEDGRFAHLHFRKDADLFSQLGEC